MKAATELLQWCACLVLICHWQGACPVFAAAPAADAAPAYGFESARAYLNMQERDLADVMGKFEGGLFQNLDEANAINIKYKALPANYVLYRLKLAERIEKSAARQDKLAGYCKEFLYINTAEKDHAEKFMAYNEAVAEKFIPRDSYQVMDDETLRKVLVQYLSTYSMVYNFKNIDGIKIRIEKAIPYKNDQEDIGILYAIILYDVNADAESATGKKFLVSYSSGDIVSFEPSESDSTDMKVIDICNNLHKQQALQ